MLRSLDFARGEGPTIGGISSQSTEDDQHIVDVQFLHDFVGFVLSRSHRLANARNVRIVPGIVVHQNGAVGHGRYLVAVIPPGHDSCILKVYVGWFVRMEFVVTQIRV